MDATHVIATCLAVTTLKPGEEPETGQDIAGNILVLNFVEPDGTWTVVCIRPDEFTDMARIGGERLSTRT